MNLKNRVKALLTGINRQFKNSFPTRAVTSSRKPDTPDTIVYTARSQSEGKDTIDPTATNQSKTDA